MKEDIKNLQEIINLCKEEIKNLQEIINLCKEEINNNDKNITATLDLEDLKSLENLLTRYKQLEIEFRDRDNYFIKEISVCEMKNLENEEFFERPISEWFIDVIIDNRVKIVILLN